MKINKTKRERNITIRPPRFRKAYYNKSICASSSQYTKIKQYKVKYKYLILLSLYLSLLYYPTLIFQFLYISLFQNDCFIFSAILLSLYFFFSFLILFSFSSTSFCCCNFSRWLIDFPCLYPSSFSDSANACSKVTLRPSPYPSVQLVSQ